MSDDPDPIMLLPDILSYVHGVLHHFYPSCDQAILEDAVSIAVESFLIRAPAHVRRALPATRQWLIRAATFEINRELRIRARYVEPEAADRAFQDVLYDTPADAAAEEAILRSILDRELGPAIAETLWLHEVERCSSKDISAMQHISLTAVKMRIARARKLLRRVFRVEYRHPKS